MDNISTSKKNPTFVNNDKIKGLLREYGYSYSSFAERCHTLTKSQLVTRLNGTSPWNLDEVAEVAVILNLTRSQFIEIFMPFFLQLSFQKQNGFSNDEME